MVLSICALYEYLVGNPFHWIVHRADPPWGHDVTHVLGSVLSIFPEHLFWKERDFGSWMFGITGWIAALGVLVALFQLKTKRKSAPAFVLLLISIYFLVFNFTPHRIDFTSFYSHPRIFRYLAQISAFVYIAAAFFIEFLWAQERQGKMMAGFLLIGGLGFGGVQIPHVTAPSHDVAEEGRAFSEFMRKTPLIPGKIYAEFWNCERLKDMNYPQFRHWEFDCKTLGQISEKEGFLKSIEQGYVVTGGASLAWYSNRDWIMNLSEMDFQPPDTWKLLFESQAKINSWREEPLRVWEVTVPLDDMIVEIPDSQFEDCLRRQMFPLRPEDGLSRKTPIRRRRARAVVAIECQNARISDIRGLEHFTNIKILNLSGNQLEQIDVRALKELKLLLLGFNRLTDVEGLAQLEKLDTLWLGSNQLQTLDLSRLTELKDLRLDQNQLKDILGAEKLSHLKFLSLNGNPHLECQRLRFPQNLLTKSGCGP